MVIGMQQKKITSKQQCYRVCCAGCGKILRNDELKVSYDFERFYCFACDDAKIQ